MTVEIKQLVIRATARAAARDTASTATADDRPAKSAIERSSASPSSPAPVDDALVATCVREVLRELRRSKER